MMYDEWALRNLTSMVDRVATDQGDPRYFLAELKRNDPTKVLKGESRNFIFLHRMPHMALNKKVINCVNILMYFSTVGTALIFNISEISFKLFSCVCLSCDLLIIPGILYYLKYRQKWLYEDVDIPKVIMQSRFTQERKSYAPQPQKGFSWSFLKFWRRDDRDTLLHIHMLTETGSEISSQSSIRITNAEQKMIEKLSMLKLGRSLYKSNANRVTASINERISTESEPIAPKLSNRCHAILGFITFIMGVVLLWFSLTIHIYQMETLGNPCLFMTLTNRRESEIAFIKKNYDCNL